MTTSPEPDLDHLRQQVGEQLSGWRAIARDGTTRFTRGAGSRPEVTIQGRSCVDSRLGIVAELSTRKVDNDGTFQTGPVYFVGFLFAAQTPDDGVSATELTRAEATAWRNILFPEIGHCYAFEDPDEPAPRSAAVWFFGFFRGPDGEIVTAPSDFDWVSHRVRYRGMRVSLVDRDGRYVESVYESHRFPPFYQPYTESRGRYWDLDVTEPDPSAGIARCFASLSKAIARRAAIADNIRPVSLKWRHDNVVDLILRHEDTGRCYRLELSVPTDSNLDSGTYLLPASFGGGLPAKLSSAEQYAAGQIACIRGLGTAEITRQDNEVACS